MGVLCGRVKAGLYNYSLYSFSINAANTVYSCTRMCNNSRRGQNTKRRQVLLGKYIANCMLEDMWETVTDYNAHAKADNCILFIKETHFLFFCHETRTGLRLLAPTVRTSASLY